MNKLFFIMIVCFVCFYFTCSGDDNIVTSNKIHEFKPEFILISAGFDTHWTDRLTNMGWTYQAPANYLKKIKELAKKFADEQILITLEGGYELDKQAKAVYNCLRVLNDEQDKIIQEEPQSSKPEVLDYIDNKLIPALKEQLSPFWNCF